MSLIPRDDGAFVPLTLPKDGEDLLPGRQYVIDPVARSVIFNHYGITTPRYVECIQAKSPARTITQITDYADGRPSRTTKDEIPAQDATFRAFFKYKRIAKFTLDLTVVEYQRQFYADAPREPDEVDDDVPKPKSTKEPRKPKLELSIDQLMAL